MFFSQVLNLLEAYIAGNDKDCIVWHVAGLVVVAKVFFTHGLKDFTVTNYRQPVGMNQKSLFKGGSGKFAVWVVKSHVNFPQDHVTFLGNLLRRQCGMECDVCQDIKKSTQGLGWPVNVVNRALEACVGIDVPPGFLSLLTDGMTGSSFRSLEEHVFKVMG